MICFKARIESIIMRDSYYQAFLIGRQLPKQSWSPAPIHCKAVKGDIAMLLHRLTPSEIKAGTENFPGDKGRAQKMSTVLSRQQRRPSQRLKPRT